VINLDQNRDRSELTLNFYASKFQAYEIKLSVLVDILKGQCHEIVAKMSTWSSSLGLNYCSMGSSHSLSRDTVPLN
jgi:hypothetical protein